MKLRRKGETLPYTLFACFFDKNYGEDRAVKTILIWLMALGLLCASILIIPTFCHAAISAGMVWEVRTTGTQVNGGGYSTGGVDYSQADTCLASWVTGSTGGCNQTGSSNVTNDLAAAGAWTTLTSASANFTSSMVGNTIHITSTATGNFIPGWYEVATFVSTTTITVDRACASADSTAGTGYLAGAFKIGGTLDNDFWATNQKTAGNTIYIQNGTYTWGENAAGGVPGTALLPIKMIGYISTRATIPYGTDRPILNGGTGIGWGTGNYYKTSNIAFNRPVGSTGNTVLTGTFNVFTNCKFSNNSATANQIALSIGGSSTYLSRCEAFSTNGYAFSYLSNGLTAKGCYAHDSVEGFHGSAGGLILTDSIIDTCATGLVMTSPSSAIIDHNTFYNASGPTGTGISATAPYNMQVTNNIFQGFTTPISITTEEPINIFDYNAYYNNVSAGHNVNVTEGLNSIDLTATAFTSATPHASADFTVSTNVKALGIPGTWVPMGLASTISYLDIGAVQRIEPTASTGGGAWSF